MNFLFKVFQFRNIFLFTTIFLNIIIAQFQVSPMIIDFDVKNNESGVSTVDIRNNKSTPMDVSLYLRDKSFINGVEVVDLPGTFERSCADWIFFTPSKLSLGPKENKTIRINMDVPDTAKGTYWAYLFIEETSPPTPRIAEFQGTKINLNLNVRVGVEIIQTIPRTIVKDGIVESITILNNTFELESIDFKENQSSKSETELMFGLLNQPNIIKQWAGKEKNIDLDTMKIKRVNLNEDLIIELKSMYESISSPGSIIRLLKKIVEKYNNLTDDEQKKEFFKKFKNLIEQLFSYLQNFESQISNFKKSFVHFSYFNTGNSITKCKGWVEFRDIDGLTVEKILIEESSKIYPRQRAQFQVPIPKTLKPGEYSALAVIDYGGAQLVAGEIIFELQNTN